MDEVWDVTADYKGISSRTDEVKKAITKDWGVTLVGLDKGEITNFVEFVDDLEVSKWTRLETFLRSSPDEVSLRRELKNLPDDELSWLLRNGDDLKNVDWDKLYATQDNFIKRSRYFEEQGIKKWELAEYTKDLPFTMRKWERFNVSEKVTSFDDVMKKAFDEKIVENWWEIIFVVTENNELIMSLRRAWKENYLPHPSLSKWQPVLTAWVMKPRFDSSGNITELVIENQTGHFHASYESLKKAEDILEPIWIQKWFDVEPIKYNPN